MSTLTLYAVVFACICVAVFGVYRLYVWIMDAGDDRDPFAGAEVYGLTVNAAQAMDIDMTMPPEIAHDAPFPGDRARPPKTSLARSASSPVPRPVEGPGHAAAAGPPAILSAPPPPLPDPAYAAAHPGCWPLSWLESDTFVDGFEAIKAAP